MSAPVRVLVVDDNLPNREVAEGHLATAGYEAIQAEGGEEALQLIEQHRPDLVLLDVLMPGMDGFETCRQIRMLPVVGDTPILFLTALGDLGTHKQALDSGADDFLTKPINRTELLIRVRSLLRIKQLGDELKNNYDVIRSQRDELLAAQRQKEELTALIVHDLKNPLSSILSNAQFVLGRHQLGADERESLDDVVRASQSMVRLVMNLLDISRSEDGALVPHVTEFDLPTLLGEVCKEMGRRLEDKDQRLAPALSSEVRMLRGDRDLDPPRAREPDRQRLQIRAAAHDHRHRRLAGDHGRRRRARRRHSRARRGRRHPGAVSPADLRKIRTRRGEGGERRDAAATGWASCSAAARSGSTAARSGSRTAPAAAAASACGLPVARLPLSAVTPPGDGGRRGGFAFG